jgi:hypothetical protein
LCRVFASQHVYAAYDEHKKRDATNTRHTYYA